MKKMAWLFLSLLLLVGCNTELYQNLPQEDANQMIAILMLNQIDVAAKRDEKTGKVTLSVDKAQFVNAVELLRQKGFPKTEYVSIETMFPSGQLVSSPDQEKVKINYLKEQQLERTLASMDGVISVRVTLAEEDKGSGYISRNDANKKSAAIYIKYSPEANLTNYESQIRGLIKNAVPDLPYENISLFLQPAEFRYQSEQAPHDVVDNVSEQSQFHHWVFEHRFEIIIGCGVIFVAGVFGILFFGRRK